ncbi:MAG: HIT family protein [Candidatus Pacearchaeota archaeon]|jgi:diadenosine tetraphosphate (Ap4A) HIT family hydrolase
MKKEEKPCTFCVLRDKGGHLYEDEFFYSRFDRFPCTPGHVEVIPKKHVADLQDLTKEEWTFYFPAIKKTLDRINKTNLEKLYKSYVKEPLNEKSLGFCKDALKHPYLNQDFEDCLIGWNNGEKAGRTVHHLHLHIIPAYPGDIREGGIRHAVEGKGFYR